MKGKAIEPIQNVPTLPAEDNSDWRSMLDDFIGPSAVPPSELIEKLSKFQRSATPCRKSHPNHILATKRSPQGV